MDHKELLEACTSIGFHLLENGGEIYRVEETILRICRAYGAEQVEAFAIPSSIVVTIDYGDGDFITKTRRIRRRDIDLDKVDQLNDLSRAICRERPDYGVVKGRIAEILASPGCPFLWRTAATAAISFFFTLFFGGNLRDAAFAFFAGAVIALLGKWLSGAGANGFFITMLSSGAVAAMAVAAVSWGLASQVDKIVIGTLMNLVPGIAITNSMRDIIAGDTIAGILKMTEAVLTAVGIAVGVTVPMALLQSLLG
ncbi:MAG: threonine/serine exporter family protein [Oscillospiraceae bacterium]|nr:threonine/serine exporter family protein [Oscillospiraceae bacterium]